MNAFLYGTVLQWKLDMRSRSSLVSYYIVPLIFFALMSGIFTSVMPQMRETLIQCMIVMGVSMGSFVGLPPSVAQTYGSDVKKVYRANGVPVFYGIASVFVSAFINLLILCAVIILCAPAAFGAALPENMLLFFAGLMVFIISSLSVGCILGTVIKNQSKITMIAQLVFLPSIMLSGIMFPADLLPEALEIAGAVFPAYWGYRLMLDGGFDISHLWYPVAAAIACISVCALVLKRTDSD